MSTALADAERPTELALAESLERALRPLWPEVTVIRLSPLDVAVVSAGTRSAQVALGTDDRRPSVDLQCQGVSYGSGTPSTFEELAKGVVAFVREAAPVATLRSQFPWVRIADGALAHEKGPEAYVSHVWKALSARLEKEPRGSPFRLLTPLVEEARGRPRLRALMPFFTADRRLGFSRTTGAPYPEECPTAKAMKEGRFSVFGAFPSGHTLGEGDAARAADVIEANLPTGITRAVHGTAHTLPRRR